MFRLARSLSLWLLLSLFLPMSAWAEDQVFSASCEEDTMMNGENIRASLLITDAANEVYSIFGHCALRLSCSVWQRDYCFSFEISEDNKNIIDCLSGTSKAGFKMTPTDQYLKACREEHRGVTEYPLNLTVEEKLHLWQSMDDHIAKGFNHRFGYMHDHCSSQLVRVVNCALGTRIKYNELPAELQGSYRDLLLSTSEDYPWSCFFWQTIMGAEGDEREPIAEKLIPRLLPVAWEKATIGSEDRHLIEGPGTKIVDRDVNTGVSSPTPLAVFTILLIIVIGITIGELHRGWYWSARIADAIILLVHTLLSTFLMWLVLFSTQDGMGWNWYLPVFNLLPFALWLLLRGWRRIICAAFCIVVFITLVLTPFIPQLDLPHALLIACIGVRLIPRVITTK